MKWALGFRAEGLGFGGALLHGWRYLAKQAVGADWPEEGVEDWLRAGPAVERPAGAPTARLGFLGDLMWTRGRPLRVEPSVEAAFAGCDALVGNLETPLDPWGAVPRRWPDQRRYNSAAGELLVGFGGRLRAVSLANNHALDRGPGGLARTAEVLAAAGVVAVGTVAAPVGRLRVGGLEIGLAAACWGLNTPGAAAPVVVLPGLARARRGAEVGLEPAAVAARALEGAALRVLLLHWGHEFECWPSRAQVEVAERLVDMGWDLVIGSHPHVAQPVRGVHRPGRTPAWVAFSLGNAVSVMPGRRAGTGWLLPVDLWARPEGVVAVPGLPVGWANGTDGSAHWLRGLRAAAPEGAPPLRRGPVTLAPRD